MKIKRTSRLIVAVVAALMVTALLSGCSTSDGAIKDTVSAAVETAVPHIIEADVSITYDGLPPSKGIQIRMYMDRVEKTDVKTAVEKALKIGWTKSPIKPRAVSLMVIDGPKTEGKLSFVNEVNLNDVAKELNLGSADHTLLIIQAKELEHLYGPWKN